MAGSVALLAAVVAWRRFDAGGRRAAWFCLVAASGVVILAAVSIWRPILDGRYAGVMWLPLFALAGVGLAAMPRRLASVVIAAVAVPAIALSAVPTHAETSFLVPELDASVGGHDAVLAAWGNYLVLLDEADGPVLDRLHVLSTDGLPWFVGTAAYPPGAIVHSVPAEVVAAGGRIFWVADQGVDLPGVPPGYEVRETRCVNLACLTVYGAPGG